PGATVWSEGWILEALRIAASGLPDSPDEGAETGANAGELPPRSRTAEMRDSAQRFRPFDRGPRLREFSAAFTQARGAGALASDVHLHRVPVQLHQVAPRLRLALAHQARERALGLHGVERAELDAQQPTSLGVERGVPQLLGGHFAQALEAADAP